MLANDGRSETQEFMRPSLSTYQGLSEMNIRRMLGNITVDLVNERSQVRPNATFEVVEVKISRIDRSDGRFNGSGWAPAWWRFWHSPRWPHGPPARDRWRRAPPPAVPPGLRASPAGPAPD
eukprot:76657-Prorocentrum_minimum.AAC.1